MNEPEKSLNKRKHERIYKKFTLRFRPLLKNGVEGAWDLTLLGDLSAGGLVFPHSEKLKIGLNLELIILFPMAENPIYCQAEVLRVQKEPPPSVIYNITAKFISMDASAKRMISLAAQGILESRRKNN